MSQQPKREVAAKPFVWLSLPAEAPQKFEPRGFEVFRDLTGRLDLAFVVESAYFYVGSGAYDFNPNAGKNEPEVWYTFFRRNGQICVPGTSLKGAIRSIVEAISNSCVSQTDSREYLKSTHDRCSEKDQKVCVSCSLFGRTGWRGRLHFADATPGENVKTEIVKINDLWPPLITQGRKFYAGNRFQPLANLTPEKNHRFVEAVPKGSKFTTSIFFENVQPEELGLVCCALGWDVRDQGQLVQAFMPKIGGAKPRCFGMVRFTAPVLTLWNLAPGKLQLSHTKISGREALDFVVKCIVQCKNSCYFDGSTWQRSTEAFTKSMACPQGLY